MEAERIRALLSPFSAELELGEQQILQISTYLDLLVRWNARMNLTAVRQPDSIIQRHFGESLFAAVLIARNGFQAKSLADIGSGAGFPGLPVKIAIPQLTVTLIESQQKKATFLKEVVRELSLPATQVWNVRAEAIHRTFELITLRAVESFQKTLSTAARLVHPGGSLVILIGVGQVNTARSMLPAFQWDEPISIPLSDNRVILIGQRA